MVIVRATADSESGMLPPAEMLETMGKFNEEMIRAGVMLSGEGLQTSSKGARIRFGGAKPVVTQGPFTDTTVAGFWIIRTGSKEEAIDWMKRAPFEEGELEIRQIFEAEDFGDNLSPQMRDREERLRAQAGSHAQTQ